MMNLRHQAILDRIKEGSIEEQKIHDGSLRCVWLIIWSVLTMQVGEIQVDDAY